MYYTYVLVYRIENEQRLYIGSTDDLKTRFRKHKTRSVKTTMNYETIDLVYYEACNSKSDARRRELQLKTGFGRGYLRRRLTNDKNMRV